MDCRLKTESRLVNCTYHKGRDPFSCPCAKMDRKGNIRITCPFNNSKFYKDLRYFFWQMWGEEEERQEPAFNPKQGKAHLWRGLIFKLFLTDEDFDAVNDFWITEIMTVDACIGLKLAHKKYVIWQKKKFAENNEDFKTGCKLAGIKLNMILRF